ncbi:MAG: hypothetical protein COW55_11540 [Rhodobacteraceae bacterium CG17_big_fil_post_rev_8_21_14_2_50_65_11]|nr:MAG: hypothetical protein COW55_11540 [Rhodobacteraceae bacterium CG17_big_fil_post_rev_8_21_14_2_50_65_11]
MTALTEYQRLESTGLWRETQDSQRREVLVSLGDATLTISTMSETALAHWSLPAVNRLNPGRIPALYAPDAVADEELEISDPEMIDALTRVLGVIERRRPHPGRLRHWIVAVAVVVIALLAALWLPGALTRQTAAMLPDASRNALGSRLLATMVPLTGRPCTNPAGIAAVRDLSRAVFGPGAPQIVVLPSTAQVTAHLPGNILVLNRSIVEDYETPEIMAGFLLAEAVRRDRTDPVLRLLDEVGLIATFHLLTTGEIDESHLRDHATHLLTTPPVPVADEALLARFERAGISSEPYAYALDITGESVLDLIEGDPMRGRLRARLITDQTWIAAQQICGE